MNPTEKQQLVLDEMRAISRRNLYLYRDTSPYLFQQDCKKVAAGDAYCVFGMGALSFQVGRRLGWTPSAVLGLFKRLERKGLVIREASYPSHHRPRYWWPVGFAAELEQ